MNALPEELQAIRERDNDNYYASALLSKQAYLDRRILLTLYDAQSEEVRRLREVLTEAQGCFNAALAPTSQPSRGKCPTCDLPIKADTIHAYQCDCAQPSRGKCDECESGRWFDASHGCTRKCNACNGTGFKPDCAQPPQEFHDQIGAVVNPINRDELERQPERQEADIVLTDPEHIGVTVRPDGAIGISLRVEYTHKDDWPAISRECAQELWDVLSHTLSIHVDDISVDRFAAAMKAKLAKKREQGRAGWDDPTKCTIEALARMLIQHAIKGDPLDVGNFAMMLWNRGCEVELLREAKLWLDAPRVAPSTPQDDIVAGLRSSIDGLKRIKESHVCGEGTWYDIQYAIARFDRAIAALSEKS